MRLNKIRGWTPFLPDERRAEVLDQLSQASSPSFDFFLLTVLSTTIATFGLITDSAAVVIGAMLVAPLMSPILGLSLASVAGEHAMFQRALVALVRGVILSIALSAILSWMAQALPFDVLQSLPGEVLARTHPTPFDLVVALAGGAAAAYALAQPHLSAALPGVAIATALVPPLCTVGVGLSVENPGVTFGALLLFLTNLVTISFAGIAIFAVLGFRPRYFEETWFGMPRGLAVSTGLVMLVTVPLVVLTLNFVEQSRQERALRALEQEVRVAMAVELNQVPFAQLVDLKMTEENSALHLLVTVRASRQFSYSEVIDLQKSVATRLQRTIELELVNVPVIHLDPQIPPTFTPTFTPGPSATLTPTATATFTPMPPTHTPTTTPTPTHTSTPTPSPTATPVLAYVANSNGKGIFLRQAPAGEITGSLPEGSPVQILYRSEIVNKVKWFEVRDLLGRTGWIRAEFLIIKP